MKSVLAQSDLVTAATGPGAFQLVEEHSGSSRAPQVRVLHLRPLSDSTRTAAYGVRVVPDVVSELLDHQVLCVDCDQVRSRFGAGRPASPGRLT